MHSRMLRPPSLFLTVVCSRCGGRSMYYRYHEQGPPALPTGFNHRRLIRHYSTKKVKRIFITVGVPSLNECGTWQVTTSGHSFSRKGAVMSCSWFLLLYYFTCANGWEGSHSILPKIYWEGTWWRSPYWTHPREPVVKYMPTKSWEGDEYRTRNEHSIKWHDNRWKSNTCPIAHQAPLPTPELLSWIRLWSVAFRRGF